MSRGFEPGNAIGLPAEQRERVMGISFDQYCTDCLDIGLLTEQDVSEARSAHPTQDVQGLARWLVRREKLTAFQAQQAYAGRARTLVLGNYVVLDKLGQGGMGAVYKARHKVMKRIVALKVLSNDLTKTQESVQRFLREVEAAAQLEHANIVTAHDADCVGKTHFLVMQYIDGSDLSSLVKDKGALAVDKAVNCVLQAARGLEYAHARGIVHRDIKPANLLLDRDGTLKILDMGLARFSNGAGRDELTHSGAVMGTVDYMPPEQAMSSKLADARSDIYSLGVTLWYVLTGRAAYDGDSMMAKLLAHREAPVPSLSGARAEIPAALDAVFRKMVAKKPEQRYQTMTEVIAALEDALKGDGSAPSIVKKRSEESRINDFIGSGRERADSGLDFLNVPSDASAAAPATAKRKSASSERTISPEMSFESTDAALPRRTLGGKRSRKRAKGLARLWEEHQLWVIGGGATVVVVALALMLAPSSPPRPADSAATENQSRLGSAGNGNAGPEQVTVTRGHESQKAASNARTADTTTTATTGGVTGTSAVTATVPTSPGAGSTRSFREISLVDGQVYDLLGSTNLNDWEQFGGSPDSWNMEGWVLTGRGPLNRLVYRPATFTDFDLRAECRLSAGANSGIYLRCDLSAETYNGYEIQLGQVGIPSTRDTATGGLYGRAPFQLRVAEDDAWFVVAASVRGSRISVSVNGKQTIDYTDPNNTFRNGYVGVQGHHPGMKVEFRQLHVMPVAAGTPVTPPNELAIGLRRPASQGQPTKSAGVPAGAWENLFNGRDLTGWRQMALANQRAVVWSTLGGILKPAGSERGLLISDRRFSDFELEIEYRTPPGGNSGICFWLPEGSNFNIASKLEVQICDDVGAPAGDQRADRLTGAIYNLVSRTNAVPVRANVWHTMNVSVVNKQLEVRIDDVVYTRADLATLGLSGDVAKDIAQGQGHIGLMAWGSAVEFRSVRVKDIGRGGVSNGRPAGL